jgi:hypothetical protein
MANKKNDYKNTVKQLFGNDLTAELRQLIDLAVRKEFNPQDFIERLVNTNYFDRQYPGLVEKNGTIADALSGQVGQSVSVNSLASALSNYRKGLDQFQSIAQTYGEKINRNQFALALKNETSATEFAARLKAMETIDDNPELGAAWEAAAKAQGLKPNKYDLYKAAVGAGDKRFMALYESAQLQTNIGIGAKDARDIAGSIPHAATFDDVNKLMSEVRGNIQGYMPELQAQGINAAKLVKVLGNPDAYGPEVDKIRAIAEQRASLHGRPVVGTYGQQGPGGSLSQFPQQGQAAYG